MPPYVEILARNDDDVAKVIDIADGLLIGCSPDAIADDNDPFTDWLGGYALRRSLTPSQHDGHAATLISLHDSMGEREVGRLVLRNDALRDARLEVVRIFEFPEARDKWIKEQEQLAEGTDEVKTVELDFAYDEDDLSEALVRATQDFDLSYRIVNLKGPGGGWPVIKFTGTNRELRRFARTVYQMGKEDVAEFIG